MRKRVFPLAVSDKVVIEDAFSLIEDARKRFPDRQEKGFSFEGVRIPSGLLLELTEASAYLSNDPRDHEARAVIMGIRTFHIRNIQIRHFAGSINYIERRLENTLTALKRRFRRYRSAEKFWELKERAIRELITRMRQHLDKQDDPARNAWLDEAGRLLGKAQLKILRLGEELEEWISKYESKVA